MSQVVDPMTTTRTTMERSASGRGPYGKITIHLIIYIDKQLQYDVEFIMIQRERHDVNRIMISSDFKLINMYK